MPAWVVILAIAVAAAVLGTVVLSLLAVLFFWLLFPDALKDGQFGLIFFLTVPAGGFLGAGLGALLAYHRLGKPPIAGWVWWVGSSLVGAAEFIIPSRPKGVAK